MALDLVTPFTKVQLEEEIKDTGRKQVGILGGNFNPIDEKHRLNMLMLAINGIPGLDIETIELERKGISYTYDTMKLLTEANPDTDYYFIIGADMVEYLPKWHRIDELIEMVQFVGVPRPKYKAGTSYPVIWVDVPLMDISSSAVRSYIKKDRIPNFMVPQSVLAYIKKAGLYK